MSRAWVIFKRIGRLLKFLVICIVITVCALLIWRVSSTGMPDAIEGLAPNQKLKEAYSASQKKDKELYVFRQEFDTLSRGKTEGYFAVPEVKFIPDANQAQIVFRYNNSTVRSLAKDYSLKTVPAREEELFDVSLLIYVGDKPKDTSSDISKDEASLQAIRLKPTKGATRENTTLYNFYRYTFDFENADTPIDLNELIKSEKLIAIHVQVYYKGDLDYSNNPYGALCIYDYRHLPKTVELTDDEKEALGN